jgi:hypothetical protein
VSNAQATNAPRMSILLRVLAAIMESIRLCVGVSAVTSATSKAAGTNVLGTLWKKRAALYLIGATSLRVADCAATTQSQRAVATQL